MVNCCEENAFVMFSQRIQHRFVYVDVCVALTACNIFWRGDIVVNDEKNKRRQLWSFSRTIHLCRTHTYSRITSISAKIHTIFVASMVWCESIPFGYEFIKLRRAFNLWEVKYGYVCVCMCAWRLHESIYLAQWRTRANEKKNYEFISEWASFFSLSSLVLRTAL